MLEENFIKSDTSLTNQKPNLGLKSFLTLLCGSVLRSAMQFVTNMVTATQGQAGTVSALACMVNVKLKHSKILYQPELHVTVS